MVEDPEIESPIQTPAQGATPTVSTAEAESAEQSTLTENTASES